MFYRIIESTDNKLINLVIYENEIFSDKISIKDIFYYFDTKEEKYGVIKLTSSNFIIVLEKI